MLKKCNKCGFQQNEFLHIGGRNYCKNCNYEVNINSNQILAQKEKTAHELKLALGNLRFMLEALEKFTERAYGNNYPSFRSQLYERKVEDDNYPLENSREQFLTQLLIMRGVCKGEPEFFRNEIKKEFHKWFSATGIDVNNCPDEIKNYLFEVNEVLEDRGEKIVEENEARIKNMKFDPKGVIGLFGALQEPMNKAREEKKDYEDLILVTSKEKKVEEIDGVITEYDGHGRTTKRQNALIHNSAEEIRQINKALGITQTTSQGQNYRQQLLKVEPESVKAVNKSNQDNNKGGILAIIGAISALAIASACSPNYNKNMVNNNLITKENYKKVEEIRELESQIPTYEEFVKNYQSDQEVNSSYENEIEIYNDISSPKTYGPMYRASAESSREAFIPLKIRCLENNSGIISTQPVKLTLTPLKEPYS
ncbi:15193_t:CDS:2, partial [Dentiscutata erythropus]